MISMLKSVGQLKRKGKFDPRSEFMKAKHHDAISGPKIPDSSSLLGNPASRSGLDDINNGLLASNAGGYTPTEFPLEAKFVPPRYELDSASPSSKGSNNIE